MLDENKRQRAMRHEVRISRQAMSIVQPINDRIDSWQRSAARLVALGLRARTHDANNQRIRIETEQLLDAVRAEIVALRDRMRDLPTAVASSGRLLDTQRSLASIAAELDGALATLDKEGRAGSRPEIDLVPEPEYLEIGHEDVKLHLPVSAGR